MKKMINTARNLDIMAKAAYWVCVAGTAILSIAAIVVMFLDDTLFWNATTSLSMGLVNLELISDGMPAPDAVRSNFISGLLVCVIVLIFTCMVIRVIRNILEPMSQGKPFTSSVSKNLHKLAVIFLLAGAFSEISFVILTMLTYNNFHMEDLFNSNLVSGITVEYTIDLWFVVVFIILQLMSYVFKYGEELQQLSDETL